MATPTTPPGWRLTTVNGTRRAINPQGENVSYNQYLNAQARQSGFFSHSDYRRHAKKVQPFRTAENRGMLALGSRDLKRFKEQIIDRKTLPAADKAPGSPLATLLEDLGIRPKRATYPVGDTP